MAGRDVDLSKQEEVAAYVENLGTEYRFGCYSEKDPKGKCPLVNAPIESLAYSKYSRKLTNSCDIFSLKQP